MTQENKKNPGYIHFKRISLKRSHYKCFTQEVAQEGCLAHIQHIINIFESEKFFELLS